MQDNLNVVYDEFLKNLSIPAFNPMQEAVIDKTSSHHNLMVLAPTGSGKTLPFLIAVINKLDHKHQGVQALIIAPSRELALQIEQVFKAMKSSFKVSCCYGGHSMKVEQNSLGEAPAVIIATPGRLSDHIDRDSFDPRSVQIVVLDEFDKSLQMGFHSNLKMIFKSLSGRQQHVLTSATTLDALPDFLPFTKIETLNFLKKEGNEKLILKLVRTKSTDKVESLMRLVAEFNQEVCLVFCNHRDAVERISALFEKHDFAHGILHGAMDQIDREKNLIKFRGGAHNPIQSSALIA